MLIFENNCSGCHDDGYCISNCPHKKVPHLYCDKCKEDVEKLYKYDGQEICEECLLKEFEVIE